jgi:hypothetical protein
VLPAAMERIRRKLAGVDDGNRQMVDILTAVLTDGLPAVEAACAEAIDHGVHSVAGVGREQFVGQNRVFCVREVFWLIGCIAATRRTTKWGIRSRPLNVIRDTWNAGSHPRLASGVPASSEIAYHSNWLGASGEIPA